MNFSKLVWTASFFKICLALSVNNLAFMIIGQNDEYHLKLAHNLESNIIMQLANLTTEVPQIFIYPENFTDEVGWTIHPILVPTMNNINENIEWVVFLEDRTKVNVELLIETLEKYDVENEMWIGHALTDREATIIHHFAFFKEPSSFRYPNLGSGFAMTIPLLKRLCKKISDETYDPPNFHIDVSHEFALFVSNKGKRSVLQHDEHLCTKEGPNCATYPAKFQPCVKGEQYYTSPIYAVKTFHRFHQTRVKVVLETWGQYTKDLIFFSDKQNTSIPTVKIDVENTEQGHCSKTLEILKYIDKKYDHTKQWIILADDDTILSVSRISKLLTCFNTSSPMLIGERYRFSSNGDGYDYLTGGAGIAINKKAVKILCNQCRCPKPDSPDDMILGACAKMFGIPLVHFPYFHQARPVDYSPGYLDTNDAVSFHKHWMLDPVLVYDQYFREEDVLFLQNISRNEQQSKKDEL